MRATATPHHPSPATLRPRAVRRLGLVPYEAAWHAMREFTAARTADTPDELWQLEHPPVYTVGVAGRAQHLPRVDNGIPVVRTDRGGQITYHGPGQAVLYTLLDLQRLGVSVRGFVRLLEGAVIDLLAGYGVDARGRIDAPGVYVGEAKIAALGLRIRHGRCYHGLALNVAMDLTPFHAIDPCGYPQLAVTSLEALGVIRPGDEITHALVEALGRRIDAGMGT
ncbi:MAG: lipoyl(octanoyl) transferase LipB [Burkholderiales bacterium]|nr:lipoyl(octanoyl) transferase LipB [Burkholderiales bacterium]